MQEVITGMREKEINKWNGSTRKSGEGKYNFRYGNKLKQAHLENLKPQGAWRTIVVWFFAKIVRINCEEYAGALS